MFTLCVYNLIGLGYINHVSEEGTKMFYLMRCWDVSQDSLWPGLFQILSRVFERDMELICSWKLCCLYWLCLWCQVIRTVFKHIITCVQDCHMWIRHFVPPWPQETELCIKPFLDLTCFCVFPLVIDSHWQNATPCSRLLLPPVWVDPVERRYRTSLMIPTVAHCVVIGRRSLR